MRGITTRIAIVAVGVLVVASCSSSHPAAQGSTLSAAVASSTASTTTQPESPVPTPQQAALALARRIVASAVLPPGAQPTTAPLPSMLRGSFRVEPNSNWVGAHSEWTVAGGDPETILQFLETHAPTRLVNIGHGSGADTRRGLEALYAVDRLFALPLNVADASVNIGVERDPGAAAAVVAVAATVEWTKVRPASTYASRRDRVVIVSEVHVDRHGAVGRRVVVTDPARVARIVQVFNGQRMARPGGIGECGPEGPGTGVISYRVAFARTTSARPDVTGTLPFCRSVVVSVGGRNVARFDSGSLATSVVRVLGLKGPYLPFSDQPAPKL